MARKRTLPSQEAAERAFESNYDSKKALGAVNLGIKWVYRALDKLMAEGTQGDQSAISKNLSQITKSLDLLARLTQLMRGQPDSRVGSGEDLFKGLTIEQRLEIKRWMSEAKKSALSKDPSATTQPTTLSSTPVLH